jgi:hypothetical protein
VPYEAHELVFGGWHEDASPGFHREMVDGDFWGAGDRRVILGFRGCAKSTRAEEYALLALLSEEFWSVLFIGPSEERAAEHVMSIANAINTNPLLEVAFGGQVGMGVERQTKIVFKSGRSILGMGRDQNIRGLKQLTRRPDLIIVDDFEDEQNVLSPDGRRRTLRWFLRSLWLACHPRRKARVLATVMHPECVPLLLARNAGWPVSRYPVAYLDEAGEERPSWSARFPLAWVEREREEYRRLGDFEGWQLEMMCDESAAAETRDFRSEHFRVVPRERTFQAVYAMYDPARTVGRKSATTGKAIWSWHGRKLIVWRLEAARWLPDQLLADVFLTAGGFDPVWLGIEEDSLNEWLRQPLRQESERRGLVVPFRPMRAPKGKIEFIRALQLYFEAGEIEFAADFPEAKAQFLNFPHPPIDAPNALAYALLMRPGRPIFDQLPEVCIVPELQAVPFHPLLLCANARDGWVSAALVQMAGTQLRVLADWCHDGLPEERIEGIAAAARLAAEALEEIEVAPRGWDSLKNPQPYFRTVRTAPKWIVPGWHYDQWVNVGLVQALGRVPLRAQRGGAAEGGRGVLRDGLQRIGGAEPAVLVSLEARWTLRALSGGYCRGKDGTEPEPGPYKTLMEGIESALGLARVATDPEDAETRENWAFDRYGRRYKSAMPFRERMN